MRDVAALAEVSIKTVSRVINGEPGVAAEMAARVQLAIDRLDYRHDFAASSLRRSERRSATVGMVLEDVANPFSAAVQRAVEDVARERGVLVIAGSNDENAERERTLVSTFTSRRVDALIVMPASDDHSYLLSERRAGTPIVFVDRPPRFLDADAVVVDNHAGARTAVRHLIAHGHRRIGFLGDLESIETARLRHQGYVDELAAHRVRLDPSLVMFDVRGSEAAEAAASAMLAADRPPTAFFTAQNLVTIGCLRALRRADRHRDIALVGFDDIALADLVEPAVTVIAQDISAIGRTAAEVMFGRLDGDRSPTKVHVVPTRFVQRGSGEIRAPRPGR